MKKIIALFLVLTMAIGLLACGAKQQPQETEATDSTGGAGASADAGAEREALIQQAKAAMEGAKEFSVGYGRRDITPLTSVPLGGYGNPLSRMSKNILDPLYGTAIALSDGEGNVMVMMSIDLQRSSDSTVEILRAMLSESVGLTSEQLTISGTHTHSAPDLNSTSEPLLAEYIDYLNAQLELACLDALADMKPAQMYGGSVETENLNFVRHYCYEDSDGTLQYFGDNFGTATYNDTTRHATEVDPTMYLLKFTREGEKDIVLANWRAHAHLTGGGNKYDVSADYVGAMRLALEDMADCNFIYLQGAAGNVNETSAIPSEIDYTDVNIHGQKLAEFAMEGLSNLQKLETGTISHSRVVLEQAVDHSTDDLLPWASMVQAVFEATGSFSESIAAGGNSGIRSPYQAQSIIGRANMAQTQDIELNTIAIGDSVAIATNPNEMFDTNSMYVEEHSPYAMTLNVSYTNGMRNYVPSEAAWEYTCYESDTTLFVRGTAEIIQDTLLDMLNEMKK